MTVTSYFGRLRNEKSKLSDFIVSCQFVDIRVQRNIIR